MAIRVENGSHITEQNLREASKIIEEEYIGTVLIVSDPLHMRRSITMAGDLGMDAYPSPTPTTRYKTWRTKAGSLAWETVFHAWYLIKRLWTT